MFITTMIFMSVAILLTSLQCFATATAKRLARHLTTCHCEKEVMWAVHVVRAQ